MNQESDHEKSDQSITDQLQPSTNDQNTPTTVNCPPLKCRIVPAKFDPASKRRDAAHELRVQRANVIVRQQPLPEDKTEPANSELCNEDEKRWQENLLAAFAHLKDNYIASYSKGLMHDDQYGEVEGDAYCAYLNALKEGTFQSFENLQPDLGCQPSFAAGDAAAPSESKDAQQPQAQQQVAPQVAAAGNQLKLVNPLSALAFDLQGIDSHQALVWDWERTEASGNIKRTAYPRAPRFDSAEEIAEIAENYWMALLRDVPFTQYGANALVGKASQDLAQYADQKAPTTAANLFRDDRISGVNTGPYISQFLLRPIPYASWTIDPRMRTVLPVTDPDGTMPASPLGGKDYSVKFSDWLSVQNGCRQPRDLFDTVPRFIRNGRDIGQFVHTDVSYEQYLAAALILSTMSDVDPPPPNGALANPPCNDRNAFPPEIKGGGVFVNGLLDDCNPYKNAQVQMGFATLGFPDLFSLIAEVARRAFKAVWYQKWSVHRRLRPEEFGGRIDVQIRQGRKYPFHTENFQKLQNGVGGNPSILERVKNHNSVLGEASYLLPQAFPEGCPLHPAYGSGHATVAGACITILKAWFNDLMKLSDIKAMDGTPLFVPVVPNFDGNNPQNSGTRLEVYEGADGNQLTVGGELNKLAANIAIGRNFAGVHWRTDQFEAMRLGESVAIWLLCDIRETYRERAAFSLTTLSGRRIVIDRDNDDCFKLLRRGDVSPCPGITANE